MKKVTLLTLVLLLMLPLATFAESSSGNRNQLPFNNIDAFNHEKEQEQLEKEGLVSDDGLIKIKPGEPITIHFEDGSAIEYSIEYPDGYNVQNTQSLTVSKKYWYGVATAIVSITVNGTWKNRQVTINRASTGVSGSNVTDTGKTTTIIRKTGSNSTTAYLEAAGGFKVGSGAFSISKSYILQAHADSAGFVFLRVIK